MKILVLGVTGILGNAVFRLLSQSSQLIVCGTARTSSSINYFDPALSSNIVLIDDIENVHTLENLIDSFQPNFVINCIGISHLQVGNELRMMQVFGLFPRILAFFCEKRRVKLINISTDGVFSGKRGLYTENDLPDARDFYGIAKILGEIDSDYVLTVRSSFVGPDLSCQTGLLSWFLNQKDICNGYDRVIFSGFPTVVFAQVIRDYLIENDNLSGIYHIASEPISKYQLLDLVRQQYDKVIELIPDDSVVIDRSLSGERFNRLTGYSPPTWREMIATMHGFKFGLKES